MHCYVLKEYNNRWFVLGSKDGSNDIQILALDRIAAIERLNKPSYRAKPDFDTSNFFKDVIGVTVMTGSPIENIVFTASQNDAPYIITKPIHHSQQVIEVTEEGTTISLTMKVNPELERMLLSFGPGIVVNSPRTLRNRMKRLMEKGLEKYG
jgi:predicted DNA-binding transcriptional regulator YafY